MDHLTARVGHLLVDLGPVTAWCGPTYTATPTTKGTAMFSTDDRDDTPTTIPAPRPTYRVAALRRMPLEDQVDAALTNLRRTGRASWGRRADRAARKLAATR